MTRTALLPTTGDPYACTMFLQSYRLFWKDSVDTLRVFINGKMSDDVFDYVYHLFEQEGAIIQYHKGRTGHGKPLDALIASIEEDYFYITEDDFYILAPSLVDGWFNVISGEVYNAIGSMRGCCNAELIQKEAEVFSLTGKEAQQPNFWPCLFLGKRENIQALKHGSGPRSWQAGELIPELNYITPFAMAGDTFVSASIELRGQGLNIYQVDQHRLCDVLISKNFSPGWVHIGSCANALVDLTNKNLIQLGGLQNNGEEPTGKDYRQKRYPEVPDEGIRALFEERAAMWQLIRDWFPIPVSSPACWLNEEWTAAINRMTSNLSLNPVSIASKRQTLETILKPLKRI
jgi:hypothetical protein